MNKKSFKLFSFYKFFFIYILILLFTKTYLQNDISLIYPSSLQLIDNNNYVVVAEDGIHFFDQNFSIELISKKINFSLLSKDGDNEKVSMAQFSNDNGGNILIIVKEMLYILDREGTLLNTFNITEKDILGNHYGLTPYKKDNNNKLNFII